MKNILLALISISLVFASCKKEFTNPPFDDGEMNIYLYGSGERLTWKEYNLTVGDSLPLQLQIAPANSSYKWVLNSGDPVSTTLKYTYHSLTEGTEKLYFIATQSGVTDTIIFSINSALSGETSKLNEWQSFEIEKQTGEFTAEFDMVASKDSIDAVTGFLNGIATTYSDLSCIVRFSPAGKLDVHNGTTYAADAEILYVGGQNFHVRMEINMATSSYDVFVTPEGEAEVQLADEYGFRKANTSITYWAMVYGNYNLPEPGSHRVSNMTITSKSQNEAPIIAETKDFSMVGGTVKSVVVSASDPLGEGIDFTTNDLPRFASFTDNGDGTGTYTFAPYGDCGGCDDGTYEIVTKATNRLHTSNDTFYVKVADVIEVIADLGDAHIYETPRYVDVVQTELVAGKMDPSWLPDYTGPSYLTVVLPFLMPEIPAGSQIVGAEVKLQVSGSTSWDSGTNYDLYGINARTDAAVLGSDYFVGPYDTDSNPEVTAVEPAIMTGNQAVGVDVYGTTGLLGFINNQVQNGASGKYVFLRINSSNLSQATWSTLKILSANNGTGVKPTLVLSMAPVK